MGVVAKSHENVEVHANETFGKIKAWLDMIKLDLVDQKTEAVFITNCRKGMRLLFLSSATSPVQSRLTITWDSRRDNSRYYVFEIIASIINMNDA